MDAGLEWLGLVVGIGFVDELDVEEEAMAVDCSQSLGQVEGVVSNVVHCHLADDDDKCNIKSNESMFIMLLFLLYSRRRRITVSLRQPTVMPRDFVGCHRIKIHFGSVSKGETV